MIARALVGRGSLSRRLAVLVSAGFAAIWLMAILATALVLRSEQKELLDLELRETARILLPMLAHDVALGDAGTPNRAPADPTFGENPDETLVYQLVDRSGAVLARSGQDQIVGEAIEMPTGPAIEGYSQTRTHVFYTTGFNAAGLAVRFGDPRHERFETYRDSLLAFLAPMLAILPLGYLMVGSIARIALRPLDVLREQIAQRDHGRLDPLDADDQPDELRAITATMNRFMSRLSRALETERAFATSAAHELRTPVATALAQIQRLRADRTPASLSGGLDRMERAMKRMARLVARLLELARADAGIGRGESPQDIVPLVSLLLEETARVPDRAARLRTHLPDRPVFSSIDPDAFAIAAGNLIDNAFQHAAPGSLVTLRLDEGAILSVANGAPAFTPEDLARLPGRFQRAPQADREGFGLGLYIAEAIARQAGGRLELRSTTGAEGSMFEARLHLPQIEARTADARGDDADAHGDDPPDG